MDYGKRLKMLRESNNLSQQELADRLKLNRSTYARYELNQTQPDLETLKKIADYYQVSVDFIMERTNKRDQNEEGEMYFFDKDKWSPEEIEEARAFIEARRQMKKNKK